jgi:hypothetical protein
VTPFDPAVVLLAAHGVAAEHAIQRGEEALGEGGDVSRVVATELGAPVGLELDEARDAMATDPEQGEKDKGEAIVLGQVVAVGEETET